MPRPRRSAGLIEIELSRGRRLRVGPDVDGDALRRVLDALDHRMKRSVVGTAARSGTDAYAAITNTLCGC